MTSDFLVATNTSSSYKGITKNHPVDTLDYHHYLLPLQAAMMDAASLQQEQQVLHSSHRQSSIDVGDNKVGQVPPEDSTSRLPKLPKKGRRKPWHLRGSCGCPKIRVKAAAQLESLRRHPNAPEVDPYYYQINWPQEVLLKWTTERFDRETFYLDHQPGCSY